MHKKILKWNENFEKDLKKVKIRMRKNTTIRDQLIIQQKSCSHCISECLDQSKKGEEKFTYKSYMRKVSKDM